MYIRFTTSLQDDENGQPLGIFSAAYHLLDNEAIEDYQWQEIRTTLDWFNDYLEAPLTFRRTANYNRQDTGVCWFKPSAKACMSQVRYLAHLVSEHDIEVRELKTDNPGYLIWEDYQQVVAEPFATTPR